MKFSEYLKKVNDQMSRRYLRDIFFSPQSIFLFDTLHEQYHRLLEGEVTIEQIGEVIYREWFDYHE